MARPRRHEVPIPALVLLLALSGCLTLGGGERSATGGEPKPPAPAPAAPGADKGAKDAKDAELKAFVDRVNAAIDQGQKFLLSSQLEDGTWKGLGSAPVANAYGEEALGLLALAKTGIRDDHKQMRRGLAALDTLIGKQKSATFNNEPHTHSTYAAACVAMLMDALYAEHPTIGPDGRPTANKVKLSLPSSAKSLLQEIVTFYEGLVEETALWDPLGRLFEDVDALLCPTIATTGLLAGNSYLDEPVEINGHATVHHVMAMMTLPFNLFSRCPVLSVPSGVAANGVPTGVQIVGRTYEDISAFQVAAAIEAAGFGFGSPQWRPSLGAT